MTSTRHNLKQPMTFTRCHRGFTLLEVMVALVIVAMIAAALFAALTVAFKARKSAVNNLTNLRQLRTAMQVVGQDIQTTLPPTGILAGAFTSTPDDPQSNVDLLVLFNTSPSTSQLLTGAGDIQQVTLSVMTQADVQAAIIDPELLDTRDQGQRLLVTTAEPGSDLVLVRRVTRQLLPNLVTPEPPLQIIARHVQTFRVRLYDGQDWLDAWDSSTTDNTLPQAVEITLEIKEPVAEGQPLLASSQPRVHTMTRVFQIPCYAAAVNDAQQSESNAQTGGSR